MADFSFSLGRDFLNSINALSQTEEIIPNLLSQAAPYLKAEFEKKLRESSETGELASSLKITKPKKAKNGDWYIAVRPSGESKVYLDKNGVRRIRKVPLRNIEKLIFNEYGTPSQTARPILPAVIKNAENICVKIMTERFKGDNK